ncbi:MAG: type II toxin-antitoxin system HicA family toxin [Spirochaetota bacterium]|jgi:predicted RNA binding protein YcfA (HicA-like mRNA interferase family)|nr:type II toxin-antitoxin system HicA family toxin [Spirochaetota bacterium]
MTGKDLIKILKEHGWVLDRVSGSHHIMIKEGRRSIPVPVHGKKEIPIGLSKKILKQAGIERS